MLPSPSKCMLKTCRFISSSVPSPCLDLSLHVSLSGGYLANSLAIMSDAAHMLSDFAAFLISLFALWIGRLEPSRRMSFGWHRAGKLKGEGGERGGGGGGGGSEENRKWGGADLTTSGGGGGHLRRGMSD